MNYLVDTNVISEIIKPRPDQGVVSFLQNQHFLLSTLVFAELSYGAYKLDAARAERGKYITFIENLKQHYRENAIGVSLEIAELSGKLRAAEKKSGRILAFADAIMAATALHTKTTLVTRNIKDFVALSVPLLNPFSSD